MPVGTNMQENIPSETLHKESKENIWWLVLITLLKAWLNRKW
jgi:hypothetical protein